MTDTGSPKVELLRALADRCVNEATNWRLDDEIAQAALERPPCGTAGPPRFTADTDVALSLVPDFLSVCMHTGGEQKAMTYVELFVGGDIHWGDSQADTLPRAVCAAALRARADLEKAGGEYQPKAEGVDAERGTGASASEPAA